MSLTSKSINPDYVYTYRVKWSGTRGETIVREFSDGGPFVFKDDCDRQRDKVVRQLGERGDTVIYAVTNKHPRSHHATNVEIDGLLYVKNGKVEPKCEGVTG